MNDQTKTDILAAIRASSDEVKAIAARITSDQVSIRSELAALVARVESLEAHRGACDARHNAHEQNASLDRQTMSQALVAVSQTCDKILAIVQQIATSNPNPNPKPKGA